MYIKKHFNVTILVLMLKQVNTDCSHFTPQDVTCDGNIFKEVKSGDKKYKIHLHLYIETNIGFTDQPSLCSCSPHYASVELLSSISTAVADAAYQM